MELSLYEHVLKFLSKEFGRGYLDQPIPPIFLVKPPPDAPQILEEEEVAS